MSNQYIDEIKKYLLDYFESVLDSDFCDVLYDSEIDPNYSAVTAANHLICYIDILKHFGQELKYDSVESFFKYYNYTTEEYEKFKKLYLKESQYYIGKIYNQVNTGDGSVCSDDL